MCPSFPPQGFTIFNPAIGYPNYPFLAKNVIIGDMFNRNTLNPTNAIALYTVSGSSVTITAELNRVSLVTGAVAGDDATCRTSGLTFVRPSFIRDNSYSSLDIWIIWTSTNTLQECFIGLLQSNADLTTLPTTARHVGIYHDMSVANDWLFTSANGTTQVTATTATVIGTGPQALRIQWTGINTVTLTFYSISNIGVFTQITTANVTAFEGTDPKAGTAQLHFFISTETTAAKTLGVLNWNCLPR